MQMLLRTSGGEMQKEPFASHAVRFINQFNCMSFSDQQRACPASCIINTSSLGALEETMECSVRYVRIDGKDVYGYGPSQRTWRYDLRIGPSNRHISTFNSQRRCQASSPLQQDTTSSTLLEPGSEVPTRPLPAVSAYFSYFPKKAVTKRRGQYERWVPDVAAVRMRFSTYANNEFAKCMVYPCEEQLSADPCTMIVMETSVDSRKSAKASALTVAFVTVLLAWASSNFGALTNKLVIVPLDNMTAMVRGLMADPMAKMSEETDNVGADSETKSIAASLIKLSTMLQIAFGEAGGDIIKSNLNSATKVNALIPGKRIQGVYGFCDVRSFTDCTECLEEEVMIFVNRIADIVHRSVSENEGAPNKNVGDAFQVASSCLLKRIPFVCA
jgi:hypothetical protein